MVGRYVAVLLPKLGEKKSIGEACDEFDRDTPLSVESTNAKRRAEGKQVRTERSHGRGDKRFKGEKKLCWSFQKGNCKFGDKCRFSHGDGGTTSAGDAAAAAGGAGSGVEAADAAAVAVEEGAVKAEEAGSSATKAEDDVAKAGAGEASCEPAAHG